MKKINRLLLVVGLFAIVSCGGGGGGGSSSGGSEGTSQATPSNPTTPGTPGMPGAPALTRSTAPRFTKTDISVLKIGEDITYGLAKEDMEKRYYTSISTINPSYEVDRNEIGFRAYPRDYRVLNVGVSTVMNVKAGGVAIAMKEMDFQNIQPAVRNLLTKYITSIKRVTFNMDPDSYFFMFTETEAKSSQINVGDIMSGTPLALRPTINGTGYKMFKFHNSNIIIDQSANLDDPNDPYNQLVATNSKIDIESDVTITGTKDNQIGVQGISNGYWAWSSSANSGTIDLKGNNSIGIFAKSTEFSSNGRISVGKNSTAIYVLPEKRDQSSAANSGTITLGENSIGMYIYKPWVDVGASIENKDGKIESVANNVIGMFADVRNQKNNPTIPDLPQAVVANDMYGEINLKGDKSIGIYSTGDARYEVVNFLNGKIIMGDSFDRDNPSIGIYNDNPNVEITNHGTIEIGKNSIGIASLGGVVMNDDDGRINITNDGGIGIYLADGATGTNNGNITTVGSPNNAVGVVVGNGSEFTNNGKIIINSAGGAGIVISGGVVKNYGDIQVSGGAVPSRNDTAGIEKITVKSGNSSIKRGDLGVYVDTLGKTNPINGLANLGIASADLLIGAEATEKTNATEVAVSEDVIKPFNDSIQSSNIDNWNVKSGSLVWEAESEIKDNNVEKVTLKKQSYAKYADEKTEEVAKALDEKYTLTSAESKDKEVFNSINKLKSGNELAKTYKEVSGGQYINVQQRINQTDEVLERELTGLKNDKFGKDGHHISTFAGKDNYEAKTPEIAKSSSVNYGAAYLYNDASNEWGAYAGAVMNKFKLEDEGKSKENVTFVKVGAYKIFNLGIVDWTLSGEGNISWNEMKRRYVSAGTVYENKADYNSYGFAVKNEVSKIYQLNDIFTFKPYGALKIGFGKFTDIKEKNSTLGLEVKGNDYYSFKPMAGIELGLSVPVGTAAKFKAGLGLGYEHELGKIENTENEAKFSNAGTSWKLKGVKGEDKGGLKSDLKAGFEAGNYNIFLTGGYNTKGKNSHVGINFGVSF